MTNKAHKLNKQGGVGPALLVVAVILVLMLLTMHFGIDVTLKPNYIPECTIITTDIKQCQTVHTRMCKCDLR